MPDVPTLKELGYDVEFYLWVGMFAPKGTPEPIVVKLREEIKKAAATDQFRNRNARFAIGRCEHSHINQRHCDYHVQQFAHGHKHCGERNLRRRVIFVYQRTPGARPAGEFGDRQHLFISSRQGNVQPVRNG